MSRLDRSKADLILRDIAFYHNIRDRGLVSVIDRAGVAAATLNEVESVVRKLVRNERERA